MLAQDREELHATPHIAVPIRAAELAEARNASPRDRGNPAARANATYASAGKPRPEKIRPKSQATTGSECGLLSCPQLHERSLSACV